MRERRRQLIRYDATHVSDHRQVPGGCDQGLDVARVLGADEGDRVVHQLARHRRDRRPRVGTAVDQHEVERVPAQPAVRVDLLQRVHDRADDELALAVIAAERRQEADGELLGAGARPAARE